MYFRLLDAKGNAMGETWDGPLYVSDKTLFVAGDGKAPLVILEHCGVTLDEAYLKAVDARGAVIAMVAHNNLGSHNEMRIRRWTDIGPNSSFSTTTAMSAAGSLARKEWPICFRPEPTLSKSERLKERIGLFRFGFAMLFWETVFGIWYGSRTGCSCSAVGWHGASAAAGAKTEQW